MSDKTERRRDERQREEQTPSKLALRAARRQNKPSAEKPVWLVGDTLTDGEKARKVPPSWSERWTPITNIDEVPGETADIPSDAEVKRPRLSKRDEVGERCPKCGKLLDGGNPDSESRAHHRQSCPSRVVRGEA